MLRKHASELVRTLFFVALIGGLAAGCGEESSTNPIGEGDQTGGRVVGQVTIDGTQASETTILEMWRGAQALRTTQTNQQGDFVFDDVAPGAYELMVWPPSGYRPAQPEGLSRSVVVSERDETRVDVSLTHDTSLPPDSTSSGRLLVKVWQIGADSLATSGIGVSVWDSDETPIFTGPTDEQGRIIFDDIAPGTYRVGIDVPPGLELFDGQENPRENVIVYSGGSTSVIFTLWDPDVPLPDGILRVFVAGDSLPVPAVTVAIMPCDGTEILHRLETDANGTAEFSLAPGAYDVAIDVPEGWELAAWQQNPLRGVAVYSSRTTWVHFDLIDPDAQSAPGWLRIQASPLWNGAELPTGIEVHVSGEDPTSFDATGATDESGQVSFEVAAGTYTVEMLVPESWALCTGTHNPQTDLRVFPGGTRTVDFCLWDPSAPQPRGALAVFVVADSLPEADIPVAVYEEGATAPLATGMTDAYGRALFSLEAGSYAAGITIPDGFELRPPVPNPQPGLVVAPQDTTMAWFLIWEAH
ncbi:MAG: hypothetical protein KAY32_09540 [Candidatus Eisenbacteria sp.]|nr:hypothetical protein [Candidatus Eisenbacteria bacterium]